MKVTRCALGLLLSCSLLLGATAPVPWGADPLDAAWTNPSPSARLRAYWWWLNSNVTKEALTRDLEQMKAKGFGGALIFDAGGAEQRGNAQKFETLAELGGSWSVRFDPRWGGPAAVEFPELGSWPTRPEPGIKHYSGTAVYAKRFDLPPALRSRDGATRCYLDLGHVRELAEVKVNGKSCGIVWAPPFRVDVTDAVKPTGNTLEIEVVNFWPNRVIGDAALPDAQRLTKTNIQELKANTPLAESGLLGPVTLGMINLRE